MPNPMLERRAANLEKKGVSLGQNLGERNLSAHGYSNNYVKQTNTELSSLHAN